MKRKLRYERLEERTVQAGNVTADVIGDTLFLSGDQFDNFVDIDGDVGFLVVNGVNDDKGFATQVNGNDFATFFGIRNVHFEMRAGDDDIHAGLNTFTTLTTLIGTMGSGNDTFVLASIAGTSVTAVDVDLGDGNDGFGAFASDLSSLNVRLGAGTDNAFTQDAIIDSLVLDAGFGDDLLIFRNLTTVTATVNLREGNNTFRIRGWQARAGATIVGGSGQDTIVANRVTASGQLLILLGAGDDSLTVRRARLATAVPIVSGGLGFDTLSVQFIVPPPVFIPLEFEA